jgi:hypothetical protein
MAIEPSDDQQAPSQALARPVAIDRTTICWPTSRRYGQNARDYACGVLRTHTHEIDLGNGEYRALVTSEAVINPQWSPTLDLGVRTVCDTDHSTEFVPLSSSVRFDNFAGQRS